jgi:hypothetical protein
MRTKDLVSILIMALFKENDFTSDVGSSIDIIIDIGVSNIGNCKLLVPFLFDP